MGHDGRPDIGRGEPGRHGPGFDDCPLDSGEKSRLRQLNIRNISSRDACGNILRCAGGHLLELKADCKHAPSVGERCRVIRDLNLRTVPEDGEFLRGVGPTLESLEVKGRATSEFFQGLFKLPMRDICLKLSSLSPAGASLDKAELLCSFSDQLHFATVRNFPKGRCHQVVEACPNTRTDGYIFHGVDGYSGAMSEGVSELAVLGSSLKALSFDVRCEIDVGELSEAARTCRNIEKIHVRTTAPFEVDVVKGILHHGKPFLREFSLNLERGNVLNASQELSNHAENLPFFGFVGAIQQRGVYESIVDNAPLLEKVHIEHACGRLDQPVENEDVDGNGQGGGIVALVAHVGDIVGTFVEYSQLRELKIRVGRNGFPRYG